jgi:DNA-binding transcriptional ArsR family regulator
MPGQDFIVVPDTATVTVSLEPAHNAIHSLMLLTKAEGISGLGEWISRTADALSAKERARHRLVILGFYYAILPDRSWSSFPAYLDHLTTCEPASLRDKMLRTYACFAPRGEGEAQVYLDEPAPIDEEALLKSADAYVAFLQERFDESIVDVALETEAYSYVINPPAMQSLIVSHLRHMWNEYLSAEWERVVSMLQDSVQAFQQLDFQGADRLEIARTVTGQSLDEEKWSEMLEKAERLVFVPSAHVGPYLGKIWSDDALWVLFGARLPEGVGFHAPDLSRAEILVRLNALADDNRLRILRLVSEEGEQPSQDIMAHLGLSQSAASRHLKQLSATGYLAERRCNGAKCYRLNRERIENTLSGVASFLLGP